MTLFVHTVRALAQPRRSVPLAVVTGSMLLAEWLATHSFRSLALDTALIASFCLVGPASWRALASPSRPAGIATAAGYVGFLAIGAACVLGLGYGLPRVLGLPWTYVVEPSSLGIVVVLFWVGAWGLGRDIELEVGISEARERAARLALEAEHSRLLALRTHLDPHFLFNTLNAIAEWCREDPAVAETATLKLASLLRTVLEGIRKPTWPLHEEVALLRRLFELYEVRDDQRYRLETTLPDPLPDVEVPTMLLLPLFENALTHGPGAGHEGEVRLRIASDGDRVRVEIANPGAFAGRREGGEGIGIAERRLALTYGPDASLSIASDGDSTRVLLSIPMQPTEETTS